MTQWLWHIKNMTFTQLCLHASLAQRPDILVYCSSHSTPEFYAEIQISFRIASKKQKMVQRSEGQKSQLLDDGIFPSMCIVYTSHPVRKVIQISSI